MFRAIYFDCDSTLTAIEGVDELGRFAGEGVRARLAELTDLAMSGARPLAEVYEERLALIAPDREKLAEIGRLYVEAAVPGAVDVVAALRHLGKVVGIVSGGLEPAVRELAAHLGVDPERVHAVPVRFDQAGRYDDFDRTSPLWRNGGKREVLAALPADQHPLCFVGDGVTDLEAADVAERFVGYGGVARRDQIERRASYYLPELDLCGLLPLVLSAEEMHGLRSSPRFAPLLPPTER